jgi:hypothetical protein
MEKLEISYSKKIHLSGIEGLIWQNNKLITGSSDCSVNVITINDSQSN